MARRVLDTTLDTRTARNRLKARGKPYWRQLEPGLSIGYRKPLSGPGRWVVRHHLGGKNDYLTDSFATADDFSDPDGVAILSFWQAQAKARDWFKLKAAEQAGGFVPLDGPYTVKDAIADYLADYKRRGGKAIDRVEAAVRAWIEPALGAVPLAKLTKARIQAWHQQIAETPPRLRTKLGETQKHRAPDATPEGILRRRSAANRVLTVLKAALNHANREGRCSTDDGWRQVRAFREADAARLRYLSDDEARRLVGASEPDFRALVTAALLTGCRYGELVALTPQDFNPDSGTLRVAISKSGKPRHVVLTEEGRVFFAAAVDVQPNGVRVLLRKTGRPWAKSEQQRPLVAACAAAKIDPPINFHGLRHTYASPSRCVRSPSRS